MLFIRNIRCLANCKIQCQPNLQQHITYTAEDVAQISCLATKWLIKKAPTAFHCGALTATLRLTN